MLGRPLNINQMYKYFYTNILSYKRTILGGGSTTFQLFIFKDHPIIDTLLFSQICCNTLMTHSLLKNHDTKCISSRK